MSRSCGDGWLLVIVYRVFRVCIHLAAGLWTCALIFPHIGVDRRAARIKRWSIQLIAICGVTLEIRQDGAGQTISRALIVCNHISWLDVFVINSLVPCRFVAKADIRDWPVLGWLCDKAGTVFISRGRVRDVRRIFEGLVTSLHAGEHVAFFPEGTTAAQGVVLPFHANLFEAAIDAKVPVQPFALRYVDADGNLHPAADFIGDMSFGQSLIAILKAKRIIAQLMVLPVLDSAGAHRRELAALSRRVIAGALGCPENNQNNADWSTKHTKGTK